jgi:hypothetical protein
MYHPSQRASVGQEDSPQVDCRCNRHHCLSPNTRTGRSVPALRQAPSWSRASAGRSRLGTRPSIYERASPTPSDRSPLRRGLDCGRPNAASDCGRICVQSRASRAIDASHAGKRRSCTHR